MRGLRSRRQQYWAPKYLSRHHFFDGAASRYPKGYPHKPAAATSVETHSFSTALVRACSIESTA